MPDEPTPRRDVLLLPWVTIDPPLTMLGYRFVRWARGAPLDIGPALRATIDTICKTYRDQEGRSLRSLTLAFRDGDRELAALTPAEVDRASWARFALATSALAARDFLRQAGAYSNATHFAMYGHGITDGIAIRTRRRDGTTLAGWPIESFKLTCSVHAQPIPMRNGEGGAPADRRLDLDLLRLVERIAQRSDDFARRARAAIDLFLTGNADADFENDAHDVRLLVAAIEGLLRGNARINGAGEFATAVESALGLTRDNTWKDAPRWRSADRARPYQLRNGPQLWSDTEIFLEREKFTIIGLWAFEIYQLRNALNHGDDTDERAWCWSATEHALFASWLFPRLLRIEGSKHLGDAPDGFREKTAVLACCRTGINGWGVVLGNTTEWDRVESNALFEKIAHEAWRRWQEVEAAQRIDANPPLESPGDRRMSAPQ
jgi:hypothetical protein